MNQFFLDMAPAFDQICLRWLNTLLHFVWQGAAIGVLVLMSERLPHFKTAAARYALLSLALVSMPLLVVATFLVVAPKVPLVAPLTVTTARSEPGDFAPLSSLVSTSASAPTTVSFPEVAKASKGQGPLKPIVDDRSQPVAAAESNVLVQQAARIVLAAYVVGACFFLLRLVGALLGGHRLRLSSRQITDSSIQEIVLAESNRVGLKFVPVVSYCSRLAVPTVLGVLRPMVLLPSQLAGIDVDQLTAILSHEFVHIRRFDLAMNLVQRLIESVLFFHPVVWYVSRRMTSEREVCCDDLVVELGNERLNYAAALVEMAERCLPDRRDEVAALAASGFDSTELEFRIHRLIGDRQNTNLYLTRSGTIVLLISIMLATLMPCISFAWVNAKSNTTAPPSILEESDVAAQGTHIELDELADAVRAVNAEIESHPVAKAGGPITKAQLVAAIEGITEVPSFNQEEFESLKKAISNGRLPEQSSLRHFVRQVETRYVTHGSWVRLVVSPTFVIPVRDQPIHTRPCTQLERWDREQVRASGGLMTMGRLISYFPKDLAFGYQRPLDPTYDRLLAATKHALATRDIVTMLDLFHWDGVPVDDPLRDFIKREIEQLMNEQLTIELVPKPFESKLVHRRSVVEYGPNIPVDAYVKFTTADQSASVSFEAGLFGGEPRFACYVVKNDYSDGIVGKRLSAPITATGANRQWKGRSIEMISTITSPDEFSHLLQANKELWIFGQQADRLATNIPVMLNAEAIEKALAESDGFYVSSPSERSAIWSTNDLTDGKRKGFAQRILPSLQRASARVGKGPNSSELEFTVDTREQTREVARQITIAFFQGVAEQDEDAPVDSEQKLAASEEEAPLAATNHQVEVLCVDANGNPVAGAEVHLFQDTGGAQPRYLHSGPLKSGEDGKASYPRALFSNPLGNFDRWIYARVPGKLVGAARSARWSGTNIINSEARVKMMPSRSVEGLVKVPSGFTPSDVSVSVKTLHIVTGDGFMDYESFSRELVFQGLHNSLPANFVKTPDAQGRIRFDDIPVRGRLYLVTHAQGLGEAQWMNQNNVFEKPIELTVEKEARLLGQVLNPSGDPAAQVKVLARISEHTPYSSTFTTMTDERGRFELKGLPTTKFGVSIQDDQKRWLFVPLENVQASDGPPKQLLLQLESGVEITGRVLDSQGKPVPHAHFSALADTSESPGLDHCTTDLQGRYRFLLPPGPAKLYFNALPDGFAYPKPQIIKRLSIQAGQGAVSGLDFTLKRKHETIEE